MAHRSGKLTYLSRFDLVRHVESGRSQSEVAWYEAGCGGPNSWSLAAVRVLAAWRSRSLGVTRRHWHPAPGMDRGHVRGLRSSGRGAPKDDMKLVGALPLARPPLAQKTRG